jgi:hypothetical protein
MRNSAKLALCLLAVVLAPAPARAREHVILDFRFGIPGSTGLRLFGADAEAVAKTDAEGLRINLPPGRRDVNWVGVELPCRIHGDFEIAVGYELLAVGDPTPVVGAGVQMRLFFDTPTPVVAAVTRLRKPRTTTPVRLYEHVGPIGETFGAARIDLDPDGKEKLDVRNFRAEQPKGRLKLVRTGALMHYIVADGGSDFHEVRSREIGTDDVKLLRLFCFPGYRPVAVDVRFTDLVIDADQFSLDLNQPLAAAADAGDTPRPAKRSLLILGGLLAAGMLVLAGVLLLYSWQKKRNGRALS